VTAVSPTRENRTPTLHVSDEGAVLLTIITPLPRSPKQLIVNNPCSMSHKGECVEGDLSWPRVLVLENRAAMPASLIDAELLGTWAEPLPAPGATAQGHDRAHADGGSCFWTRSGIRMP
jgi:hypothetical protein